ncbi:MAG TPA: isoaspartyl peptidase/L-asparaginase [Chthoniobacteraceae bacterium]|nr:isoaspartyl peptidase/L-asparaginase [Chthoniobacteraceae bacterium]
MKTRIKRLASLAVAGFSFLMHSAAADAPIALAVHGGAGIARGDLTPEGEAACRRTLEESLRAGEKILRDGGTSLDAVQAVIVVLEDSPLFNAGRGSVLTAAGTVEMDAAVMMGEKPSAGAVASVTGVRNPIRLARMVMERTPHVLLVGRGAEDFARECALPFEPPEWFITPEQKTKLEKAKKKAGQAANGGSQDDLTLHIGTVGAVALDRAGHLTAGTSTGGLTNKLPGRVGDTPLIGAGTYAEDGVCAVSCTGQGEFFIRSVVAHDVAALMKYRQLSLAEATNEVVKQKLKALRGSGGLIAMDAKGNIATPFNTPGMFRGWVKADGTLHVAIFEE